MSDVIEKSFAAQLDDLAVYIKGTWPANSPEAAFSRFVYEGREVDTPIPSSVEEAWPIGDPLQQAPVLATGGFLFTSGSMKSEASHVKWGSGFERLSKRNPFPADRQSFVFRPVELLGVALARIFHQCLPKQVDGVMSRSLRWSGGGGVVFARRAPLPPCDRRVVGGS